MIPIPAGIRVRNNDPAWFSGPQQLSPHHAPASLATRGEPNQNNDPAWFLRKNTLDRYFWLVPIATILDPDAIASILAAMRRGPRPPPN